VQRFDHCHRLETRGRHEPDAEPARVEAEGELRLVFEVEGIAIVEAGAERPPNVRARP